MVWRPTVYAVPPLVAALAAAALLWEGWRHREQRVALPFLALMVAVGAWSLSYAVQLGFTTADAQLVMQSVGIAFGGTIPVAWLVLTLVYAGREDLLNRRRLLALAAEPAALAALLATNHHHQLVWTATGFDPAAAVPVVELQFGPAYVVHITVAYVLVLAGISVLVGVLVRASAIYRRQAALLVIAAVVPLSANVAFLLGINPVPELDLTTFAFTLTGAVVGMALFRFDFLNLTPVARERLVEEFGGGLVVVDGDGRVVDHDGVARAVVDGLERVGQDFHELVAVDAIPAVDGRVVTADVDGRERTYEIAVSTLEDHRGDSVGWMVALRDVTARHEYEQRLEVANRLLRHNLRNDMTKVIGLAELIGDDTEGETATAAGRIADVARDVAEMGRKARQIETTLEAERTDAQAVPVDPVVSSVVEQYRGAWPAASISVSVTEDPAVTAPGRDLLSSALRNVVENALVHSDRDEPAVDVTVERAGEEVVVAVADDGPGIPEMERQVLEAGEESELEHASGLGLWLAHWVATACGGTVEFRENEPRGSVVSFRLPAADGTSETATVPA